MITKIGENAGAIWGALQNGALGIKALKKATKLKNEELFMALGWLAREGKVILAEGEAEIEVALA
mgnify:CR=1 FL=1